MKKITGNEPINSIKDQPLIYELPDGTRRIDHGLTIMQHFSGLAMAAIISDVGLSRWIQTDPRYTGKNFADVVAENACEMAEALISSLNKRAVDE